MSLRKENTQLDNADILECSRYWGCRIIPVKIIPGLTYQSVTQQQEDYAGVPMSHPDFVTRTLQRDKEIEHRISRPRSSSFDKSAP